jgi:hypothetical protein
MALFPLDDDDSEPAGLLMSLSDKEFRDLMADTPEPSTAPSSSVVMLSRCRTCKEYITQGGRAAGRCDCGEPVAKPQHDLDARGGF